ncbi:transporter substrate-binding domain-containing protein [Salipiger sp.]|uniref:transporter substrate-binding domain-containing protein n=1 Tax=Salipiger sp. TaxID=2078585 RepID=UPI003A97324C
MTARRGRHSAPLRVALNMNNAALVQRSGDGYGGPAIALAQRIGAATGARLTFVEHPSARSVVEAAGDGWDIAFLAIDPSRADRIAFSRPWHVIDATLLVRGDQPSGTCDAFLNSRHSILSAQGAAYHAQLERLVDRERLLVASSPSEARARFQRGEGDALAGIREPLALIDCPGSRILPDRFARIEQAVALPKGAAADMALMNRVVETFLRDQAGAGPGPE